MNDQPPKDEHLLDMTGWADLQDGFEFLEEVPAYLHAPLQGLVRERRTGACFAYECQTLVKGRLWHWVMIPAVPAGVEAALVFGSAEAVPPERWLSITEDHRAGTSTLRAVWLSSAESPMSIRGVPMPVTSGAVSARPWPAKRDLTLRPGIAGVSVTRFVHVDCAHIESERDFHVRMLEWLDPDDEGMYGYNLNALWDWLAGQPATELHLDQSGLLDERLGPVTAGHIRSLFRDRQAQNPDNFRVVFG
ncbi:MAG: barstar family protein [Myxococcota bacterium]